MDGFTSSTGGYQDESNWSYNTLTANSSNSQFHEQEQTFSEERKLYIDGNANLGSPGAVYFSGSPKKFYLADDAEENDKKKLSSPKTQLSSSVN